MSGRPTDYTEELAAFICSEMASGRSLRSICMQEDMPSSSSVYLWLSKHNRFSDNYAKAQIDRATAMAEEILDISDDSSGDAIVQEDRIVPNSVSVARDRLKVDTRKWLLSRMDPKRYGDKVTQEHTGGIEVSQITRRVVDPAK